MKKRLDIFLSVMLILITGCYSSIKGSVIDAETNQPIEGAVVLVEWTKKHGIIDHWTESFKVVETLSDKDGSVQIEGCNSPFVEPPDVTVYKKGYVAWSSRMIFPGDRSRTDFKWGEYIFRLERFYNSYSYIDHYGFITSAINSTIGDSNSKQLFFRTYSEAEESKVIHERRERDKQLHGGAK